jgi:hypothetical protein
MNDRLADEEEEEEVRGKVWCSPRAAESVKGAKIGKINLNSCEESESGWQTGESERPTSTL